MVFDPCIVVGVAFAADRGPDTRFGPSLGVADRNLLKAPVGMTDQAVIAFWWSVIKRLLKRIPDKVGSH